jgi:hypothetical protein
MSKLTFDQVVDLAAQGAEIGSCGEIELDGEFVEYPDGWVSPEYSGTLCPLPGCRAAREVCEIGPTGEWTGKSVWLPFNF